MIFSQVPKIAKLSEVFDDIIGIIECPTERASWAQYVLYDWTLFVLSSFRKISEVFDDIIGIIKCLTERAGWVKYALNFVHTLFFSNHTH